MNGVRSHLILAWLILGTSALPAADLKSRADSVPLLAHLDSPSDLGALRGMEVLSLSDGLNLRVQPSDPQANSFYSWVVIPAPPGGWDLSGRELIEADLTLMGSQEAQVFLWVVGDRGWDAVPDLQTLKPGETQRLSCRLRAAWPDGTPKLDPNQIKQVQVMVAGRVRKPLEFRLKNLVASGQAPAWMRPPGRLDVPNVTEGAPTPGCRVRVVLPGDEHTGIYAVLNLPEDWKAGRLYPVVAEYPGNIWFVPGCYSTGLPDQCVMGYGMTQGRGAITVGLPFVDRRKIGPVESGWGDADQTADYAIRMMEHVCDRWGGDRKNLFLAGFSRGALACGYIGLRNDRIAPLWKGFHACQHYDGDGWRGATLESALERASRWKGLSVFQTDNPQSRFQAVMDAMKTDVVWSDSGLGAHATTMFLDDRPSTLRLRQWFQDLVSAPSRLTGK